MTLPAMMAGKPRRTGLIACALPLPLPCVRPIIPLSLTGGIAGARNADAKERSPHVPTAFGSHRLPC